MISQLIRLNTFMDIVALDGWLILPFVKYFCSLVQLHYSLLSSFIRKQQLAKYHPAVVLDFWSSLQTTLAQPKDFDRLLLTHLRQKDLILLTWIIEIFPLETWNCFRRLGIASRRLELAFGRLVCPTHWTKCRTVLQVLEVLVNWSRHFLTRLGLLFNFLNVGLQLWHNFHPLKILLPSKTCYSNRFLSCF